MVFDSSQQAGADSDRRALEEFVVNNPELEELETVLGQFNIFEALGAVRQELRHTDFLAFLLNPSQNHGLRDYFTKRFIQKAIISHKEKMQAGSPIKRHLSREKSIPTVKGVSSSPSVVRIVCYGVSP
jgi:hypothetical protein